jgi:VWFA-related protein
MNVLRSFLLLAVAAASAAQTPPPPAAVPATTAPATVGVTASRVAVDVVVRDGKGRVVRDLRPGDLEVLEDGTRQEVLSLRLVDTLGGDRAPAKPASTSPSASPGVVAEHPLFVAFLFDRLSPHGRQASRQAALEWLQQRPPRHRQVGVFRIDQVLVQVQPFTDDVKAARDGVELALGAASPAFQGSADRARMRALRAELLAMGPPPGEAGPQGGSPAAVGPPVGADSAGDEVARAMDALSGSRIGDRAATNAEYGRVKLQLAMLEAMEALERDQQGLTTVNSLLALVNGLKDVRGRKAVVFFSEGLVLPPRVAPAMQSVISEANRGGVTFYAADAAGLRVLSSAVETKRDLASVHAVLEQGDKAAPGDLIRAMERNEDILRSDPHSGLDTLARQTGGFLVSDTNAIARSLEVAQEDLAAYYLLEYAPANELWDGRFRRIEVRAKRPGLRVQARQGYFSVRTATPTPVLDFEAPVLAAVEMAPRAADLPFRAFVVQVPDQEDESAVPVLVDVAGDVPTLEILPRERRYQQDFTVLILVRDEHGRVVRKLSRRFANSGPLDKVDEVKRGRILVLRETWLPAGRYSVETAVQDAASGRLGIQRHDLEVPATLVPSLRVSSLVVVGHAAGKPEQGTAEAPCLLAEGMQLYPGAAAPFSVSGGRPLPFFMVAHAPRGRATPRGLIELVQDQRPVFSAPLEFQQAIGRATVLGGVPLEGIEPGDYELRATIGDGVDRVVRWARVSLAP